MKRDDIVLPRGATVKMAWPVRTADGVPANLAGFSGRSQVRDPVTDQIYLNLPSISSYGGLPGIYIDIDNSYVVLYIPATALDNATWKSGIYDIEIFNEDTPPVVIRAVEGRIRLKKDATR
jgi:hypothetical protein